MLRKLARIPARVALVYAVAAGLWIVLSDRVVDALLADPAAVSAVQTYKGWFFVGCTALLLYVVLRADLERFSAEVEARRHAEEALARSEALYRAIARNLPGGAVSVVSRSLVPLVAEGPLAAELAEVVRTAPERAAAVEAGFRAALAGEVESVEEKAGERWIWARFVPLRGDDGSILGAMRLALDVTERRALLEQLEQTQRLESIGLLAGGIAHDFNNLLTVIGGNCELLLRSLPEGDRLAVLARDIQLAGERASSLTRQLLAFSRRELLEPMAIDPNAAVVEMEKLLRRLLGEDVELVTRLEPGLGEIRVDPGHLTQVLMNLAVNARDAMPRGGKLTIETHAVWCDEKHARRHPGVAPGRHVEIVIADDGAGMSDEVRARAFEPFFTTKPRGQGTGLGLAVVHGIVRQSGGHVELESSVGVGTRFRLHFPCLEEVTRPAPRPALDDVRGNESILLVEDEDAVRLLATRGLTSLGYDVRVARNGDEALALLAAEERAFALLVTDVVMPGLDGRELAEAARQRTPALRVLFTSGYTDDAILRRGVVRSEVAFLQKPYTATSLARKIRETLDRSEVA